MRNSVLNQLVESTEAVTVTMTRGEARKLARLLVDHSHEENTLIHRLENAKGKI